MRLLAYVYSGINLTFNCKVIKTAGYERW